MTAQPSPVTSRIPDDVLDHVAQEFVDSCARRDQLSPREAAEAAWVPGGPSVEQLEALISERRQHGP